MKFVDEKGKVKLKGAYDYNVGWHQNHSSLVVPKAVEARLIHGTPVADFIANHTDYFDFCRSTKVPRSSRLETTDGESLQRNTRYHIADTGPGLVKVMPPLNTDVAKKKREHIEQEIKKLEIELEKNPNSYGGVPGDARSDPRIARLFELRRSTERRIGIDVGFSVNVCNDIRAFDWSNLNRAWYVDQAQKLVEAVGLSND